MGLTTYKGLSVLDNDDPVGDGGNAIHDNFKILTDRWDLSTGMIYLTDYESLVSAGSWTPAFDAALHDCYLEDKQLWMASRTYNVANKIVIDKSEHWNRHFFGPGATIAVPDGYSDNNVFEFTGYGSGDPEGGHLKFYYFNIVGETFAGRGGGLLSGKIGFAMPGSTNVPKGTTWHGIRCENMYAGWNLTNSFTNYLHDCTAFRCSIGIFATTLLGNTWISNCKLRRNSGGGFLVQDGATLSTISIRDTVIESNGSYGVHIEASYGGITMQNCHCEANPYHLRVIGGGPSLNITDNVFGDSDNSPVRIEGEVYPISVVSSVPMRTYFNNNRYKVVISTDQDDFILLESDLQVTGFEGRLGWHVFDVQPRWVNTPPLVPQDFGHPSGLMKWEWDGDSYELVSI